jgi:hypothetical protein
MGEKRKDIDTRKSPTQHKKSKVVREPTIQALTEDDLDNIGDQVKEATDEAFEYMTRQHEERNLDMQAHIIVLSIILGDHTTCHITNRATSTSKEYNANN